MKTKQQKFKQIEEGKTLLGKSKGLIFIDFTGASMGDLTKLRRIIKEMGAKLQVVKKKLLELFLKKKKLILIPNNLKRKWEWYLPIRMLKS